MHGNIVVFVIERQENYGKEKCQVLAHAVKYGNTKKIYKIYE